MSRPRNIYVVSLWSNFHFQSHFRWHYYHIKSLKQTHLFFAHFLEYFLFLNDNLDEEREYFSNSESSASGMLLSVCLIFCQFQPGVAYKSVTNKKKCAAWTVLSLSMFRKVLILVSSVLQLLVYSCIWCMYGSTLTRKNSAISRSGHES